MGEGLSWTRFRPVSRLRGKVPKGRMGRHRRQISRRQSINTGAHSRCERTGLLALVQRSRCATGAKDAQATRRRPPGIGRTPQNDNFLALSSARLYQVRRTWADTACMDRLSIIGLVLAVVAIVGGSVLKGAGISSLWSPAAFVIVIVGTVAAILLHTSPAVFRRAFKILRWVIQPPASDRPQLLSHIVEWSNIARRQGLLGLEDQLPRQDDAFLRKGLQMLVDGVEPESMRHMLEIEVDNQERQDLAAAKVFEGMGIYAPTLGIIGAVLGLMAVMKNLADPAMLGHGIAAAFTATIYGIASANLLFLPVAAKLKSVIHCSTNEREMAIEGLIAIAQGENPRNIESKLAGYLH